jgi:hypothetical protein
MYLSDPKIQYFCTCPLYPYKLFLWARHMADDIEGEEEQEGDTAPAHYPKSW